MLNTCNIWRIVSLCVLCFYFGTSRLIGVTNCFWINIPAFHSHNVFFPKCLILNKRSFCATYFSWIDQRPLYPLWRTCKFIQIIKEEHNRKQRIGTQEPHVRQGRTQHQRAEQTWMRKGLRDSWLIWSFDWAFENIDCSKFDTGIGVL